MEYTEDGNAVKITISLETLSLAHYAVKLNLDRFTNALHNAVAGRLPSSAEFWQREVSALNDAEKELFAIFEPMRAAARQAQIKRLTTEKLAEYITEEALIEKALTDIGRNSADYGEPIDAEERRAELRAEEAALDGKPFAIYYRLPFQATEGMIRNKQYATQERYATREEAETAVSALAQSAAKYGERNYEVIQIGPTPAQAGNVITD